MALDLHDVRLKLPSDLNAILDALADAANTEKSVLVREYVEERLIKELQKYQCIHSELKSIGMEGMLLDRRGIAGKK